MSMPLEIGNYLFVIFDVEKISLYRNNWKSVFSLRVRDECGKGNYRGRSVMPLKIWNG